MGTGLWTRGRGWGPVEESSRPRLDGVDRGYRRSGTGDATETGSESYIRGTGVRCKTTEEDSQSCCELGAP